MHDFLSALILGIVEGITEFLPISSTGHLILVNKAIEFTGTFANRFDVVIQLGAILSVVVYFWKRLNPFGVKDKQIKAGIWLTWQKALIGVIPALILGALFGDLIEEKLFNPTVVSIALLVGGILLIFIENRKASHSYNTVQELPYKTILLIGFIQCLAMIPGTSRSAATIIGAMLLGSSRVLAAEFSFFLAIPTMVAATGYTLLKIFLKEGMSFSSHEMMVLVTGFLVSFLVAWLVIGVFMKFITRHNFKVFGYYRIGLGILILAYLLFA